MICCMMWSVGSRVPTRKSRINRSNTKHLTVPFRVLTDGPLATLVPLAVVNTYRYFRFRCLLVTSNCRGPTPLGSQYAHLLQNRPMVLESTRYHQSRSSGTLRSCRSHWSSTSVSSSISRTCHIHSHWLVHSPLHAFTYCNPICLITRNRHHDDVDSRHETSQVHGVQSSNLYRRTVPFLFFPFTRE